MHMRVEFCCAVTHDDLWRSRGGDQKHSGAFWDRATASLSTRTPALQACTPVYSVQEGIIARVIKSIHICITPFSIYLFNRYVVLYIEYLTSNDKYSISYHTYSIFIYVHWFLSFCSSHPLSLGCDFP